MSETPSPETPTPQDGVLAPPPAENAESSLPAVEAPVADAPVAPAPVAPPAVPVPPAFAAAPAAAAPASAGAPPAAATSAEPAPSKSPLLVPLVATAIVAALLGGGAGAGVAAWAITSQPTEQSTATGSGSQTITISNPDDTDLVTAVAAKASPSVVTISVSSSGSGGTGSGVILSEDGYILTNTHVVTLDGETSNVQIEVTTADGRLYSATVVGLDPLVDLAVIKLDDASDLTPIEWGDSDALEVGDRVVAIGAPLGLSNTVTDGIVSALDRSIQIASSAVPDTDSSDDSDQGQSDGQSPFDFWNYGQGGSSSSSTSSTISIPVVQTDAAINPGNSGGALVNDQGQLVGINVAIASTSSSSSSQSGSIGVGFSIPASLAERVAEEIIAEGEATHGLLGASVTTATSAESDVVGSVIQEVTSGGAAEKAGLTAGDIVTSFDGHPITSSTDLTAQVRALAAGSTAEVGYLRDGKAGTVTVTLGKLVL